jgi:hypothetical protein
LIPMPRTRIAVVLELIAPRHQIADESAAWIETDRPKSLVAPDRVRHRW